jgi:hypothetical protein
MQARGLARPGYGPSITRPTSSAVPPRPRPRRGVFMMVMLTSPAIERAVTGRSDLMVGAAVTVVAMALTAGYWAWLTRWRATSS